MECYNFIAHAMEGDIDLNRLSAGLQAGKKLSWEEPLILSPETLSLLQTDNFNAAKVYIYYFGAVVFFNSPEDTIDCFYQRIAPVTDTINKPRGVLYTERYSLQIEGRAHVTVTNNSAIMPSTQPVYSDIIAYTLAKSVALERIEALLDVVFDRMEDIIARLHQGQLTVPDAELSRIAASILNFKYRSISHIMILDKPDITWEIEEADRLYSTLANIFELQQRYSQIRHKSDTLLDINGVFSGLSHAKRSARLEWIIIILIAFEIVLFLFEMFKH